MTTPSVAVPPRGAGASPSPPPPPRRTRSTCSPRRPAWRWPPRICCAGSTTWVLLGFLASTYVAWGAGLRVNLAANARLLERTGTSTNALSKAAYDLVRSRTASVRARRFAAGAGYVATELVKEVPYYAGAFAVLLTDTMTAKDAHHLPRRREPRRRRLRVRAGPPHARRPRPRLRLVRPRLGARRLPGGLLQRGRARRARDDPVLRRRDARDRAGRAGAVLRRRPDAAPRLPRRPARVGDPPRRLPAGQPARDRALARARARRPRLAAVRALHAPVRGDRGPDRRAGGRARGAHPRPRHAAAARSTRGARRRSRSATRPW